MEPDGDSGRLRCDGSQGETLDPFTEPSCGKLRGEAGGTPHPWVQNGRKGLSVQAIRRWQEAERNCMSQPHAFRMDGISFRRPKRETGASAYRRSQQSMRRCSFFPEEGLQWCRDFEAAHVTCHRGDCEVCRQGRSQGGGTTRL